MIAEHSLQCTTVFSCFSDWLIQKPPNCSTLPRDKAFASKAPVFTEHALCLLVPDINICCTCCFSSYNSVTVPACEPVAFSCSWLWWSQTQSWEEEVCWTSTASVRSLLTLRGSFFNWEGITREGKNWISKRSQVREWQWESERKPFKWEDANISPDITSISAYQLSHSLQGCCLSSNSNRKSWTVQSCRQRSKRWTAA